VLAEEQVTAHPDALAMIARAADGSMRDALSLTDQVLSMGDGNVAPEQVRDALGLVPEDEFIGLLDILAERRAGDVFAFVGKLADAGIDFGQFLTGFADIVRAQLAVTLGGTSTDTSERVHDALVARKDAFLAGDLLRMLSALTELEPRFRKSGQQQLLLEALLVRFALLDRTVSLEAMLRGMSGGGGSTQMDDEPAPRRAAPPPMRPVEEKPVAPPRASDAPIPDWRAIVRDADRSPVAKAPASAATPAPVAPPRAAAAAPASTSTAVPDVSHISERWDDVVARVRAMGKSVAATALEHAAPVAVTAKGDVTIALDDANPIYEQALEKEKGEIGQLLREFFPALQRVAVRAPAPSGAPPARLTDEMVRAERLTAMRRKDPVLDRAIDTLDLDLAD
jgi:DNA polymerase-3 subunit gamma/tau